MIDACTSSENSNCNKDPQILNHTNGWFYKNSVSSTKRFFDLKLETSKNLDIEFTKFVPANDRDKLYFCMTYKNNFMPCELDDEWFEVKFGQKVTLNNLSAGDYVLEVVSAKYQDANKKYSGGSEVGFTLKLNSF